MKLKMEERKLKLTVFNNNVSDKKIYLICPVRSIAPTVKKQLDELVNGLELKGAKVHYPPRDVEQNDSTGGYNITKLHFEAMKQVNEVWIIWDSQSYGSHVDLGMAIGLRKKLCLVGIVGKDTQGKNYLKVIKEIIHQQK